MNLWFFKCAALLNLWCLVDEFIGEIVTPQGIAWAKEKGLHSRYENLRDLAASILERDTSREPLDEMTMRNLLIRAREDPGEAVRFRALCALWTHGRNRPDDLFVWPRMEEFAASNDEGIAKIASQYLLARFAEAYLAAE